MLKNFPFYLLINFFFLFLGSFSLKEFPYEWYSSLTKPFWTPPNWTFKFIWSLIFFLYSFYITILFFKVSIKIKVLLNYILQLSLNSSWSFIFFKLNYIITGIFIIFILIISLFYFFIKYFNYMKFYSLLILPYLIWLFVALSLNIYMYVYN